MSEALESSVREPLTLAPARVSAERQRDIHTECVRTMYRQTPNSIAAALGVTLYMVVTLWRSVPHAAIGLFLGLQALSQAHRAWVLVRYRKVTLTSENSQLWAQRYSRYMLGAGLV